MLPAPEGNLAQIIKVEANLLRLPLFALHTKGLKTLDAIECRGRLSRDDMAHEFIFRAYRSTATAYPGPLARSAHLAFLSLLTERGLPLQNPITWTWRDLCRRMRISCSGRTVERLKAAINSTAGLYILSTHAIYSKPASKRICTREEGLHLYDRVCFTGAELPDGGTAETNYLWISDWYLANFNALFTAPLNYDLWRSLEDRSAIASRLYEFLLLNFYNGAPILRINYENLVQFLPVKPERHPSQARQQLGTALAVLAAMEVIEAATWSEGRDGQTQLQFHRGKHLDPPRGRGQFTSPFLEEEFAGSVEVEELRTLKPPEWTVVTDFYRLWSGSEGHRPTKKELEQARAMVDQHGLVKARALIQLAVKRMKSKWPDAKTFGGLRKYLGEVSEEYDREQRRLEQDRQEQQRRQRERDEGEKQVARQAQFEATWKPVWDGLPGPERDELRQAVVAQNPFLARVPRMVERLCLEELARRRGADVS
jgi:hypothetical protein